MKYCYIIAFLFIGIGVTYAQNTLSGIITDQANTPLEEAYIYNTITQNQTVTQANGKFTLEKVTVGDQLLISILGYEDERIQITQGSLDEPLLVQLKTAVFQLDELVLKRERNPLEVISNFDIQQTPVASSQEVLRTVPGLFIAQHAGGGKAEQLFLRGFDVDHGTDVAIQVDGIPVNLVSHAHGQGYSDLHFLIPETIQQLDFGKGPYAANQGNFNTAGFVAFKTQDRFENNQIKTEGGDFNTLRTVGLFNLTPKTAKSDIALAFEYLTSDGPFESPQDLDRINLWGKYTTRFSNGHKLSFNASYFTSNWFASGQIPVRAVDQGLISRFGAIDDTEGGNTSRTNVSLDYFALFKDNSSLKSTVFYSNYDFTLFSNFTFFLNDPVNGDQIRQQENRNLFGVSNQYSKPFTLFDYNATLQLGGGFRNDNIDDIELSRTRNRTETLSNLSLGNVDELNAYAFAKATLNLDQWKFETALRLDHINYRFDDALSQNNTIQQEASTILAPKLKIGYSVNDAIQLFAKSGVGFHSNDARVVVAQQGETILPKAFGVDLGADWKPLPNLFVNTTAWYLGLEQEFVFVGDEAIVEASGRSRRLGLDLSTRYTINKYVSLNSDLTYTRARSIDNPANEQFIPLAPELTLTGRLQLNNLYGFSGGLGVRHLGDRAANEDRSLIAEGYFITDFNVNYTIKSINFRLSIENLFDVDWKETQFATNSRLANENEAVEEINFIPGTPFFIKGGIKYTF